MSFETLLIPTDGSDSADAAAGEALDLASQLEANVHLLSVADSAVATGTGYAGDSASIRTRLREQARTRVRTLQEQAMDRGLETTTAVREGIPAEEIVGYAAKQDVAAIAMGTAGRGGVVRAVVGSVADKVIRTATVPVFTFNHAAFDTADGPINSILLTTDGSDPAETAAARGVALANQVNASVHAISVEDETTAEQAGALVDLEDGPAESVPKAAAVKADRIAELATDAGLDCVTATSFGDPAEEITAYADEHGIDMIVLGTRGHGGFKRAVIGSVTDTVVRTATVPVLSVCADSQLPHREDSE